MLSPEQQHITLPDGERLSFYPAAFAAQAPMLFQQLQSSLSWRKDVIQIAGKTLPLPRLQAWYGEKSYTYSGIYLPPQPMPPLLKKLCEQVQQLTGHDFNVVLANYYRDGNDSVGWHSDDEPELGGNPVVASLSVGAERLFSLRPKHGQPSKPLHMALPAGALLVMEAGVQQHWQHAVLKTTGIAEPRISLTFRNRV